MLNVEFNEVYVVFIINTQSLFLRGSDMFCLLKYRNTIIFLAFPVYDLESYPVNRYRIRPEKEPFLVPHRPRFHACRASIKTGLQCVNNM